MAVGHTRVEAAAHFGPDQDDLLLTSYADFDADVRPGSVSSLHLVASFSTDGAADPGFDATFDEASRQAHARRDFTLRLAVVDGDVDRVAGLLKRGRLQVEGVDRGDGSLTLLLGPRGRRDADHDELVLSLVAALAERRVTPLAAPQDASATGSTALAGAATPPGARRRPRLVTMLTTIESWQSGPRRRRAAQAAPVALVAVLVALGVLSYVAPWLRAVVVPVAFAAVAGLLVLACYLILLLARQLNAQTGRLERMVRHNRTVTRRRAAALDRRLRALEHGQARLPFAEDYLEAIAEASSTSSGHLKDLIEAVESGELARTDSCRED